MTEAYSLRSVLAPLLLIYLAHLRFSLAANCGNGAYLDENAHCIRCPESSFCPGDDQAHLCSPTVNCHEYTHCSNSFDAFCTRCRPGFFITSGITGSVCSPCPAHSFCPDGVAKYNCTQPSVAGCATVATECSAVHDYSCNSCHDPYAINTDLKKIFGDTCGCGPKQYYSKVAQTCIHNIDRGHYFCPGSQGTNYNYQPMPWQFPGLYFCASVPKYLSPLADPPGPSINVTNCLNYTECNLDADDTCVGCKPGLAFIQYSFPWGARCETCPAGHYCPGGFESSTKCAPETVCGTVKRCSITENTMCLTCQPGSELVTLMHSGQRQVTCMRKN